MRPPIDFRRVPPHYDWEVSDERRAVKIIFILPAGRCKADAYPNIELPEPPWVFCAAQSHRDDVLVFFAWCWRDDL